MGENGVEGYIRLNDIAPELFTLEEIRQYQAQVDANPVIPLYDLDGKVIGSFLRGTTQDLAAPDPVIVQKLEEMTKQLFPQARVLRMDADTTAKKGGHEEILSAFEAGEADILIGTQMIVKGHDFKNVTLVGILAADLSLYVDHYRAAERTFSLLTQVVGRAGRGEKEGRAVIQTYTPRNDVILAAAEQDYDRFYDDEIRLRRLRRDPPFADHFTLTVTGPEEEPVRRACAQLCAALRQALSQEPYRAMEPEVLGPAPAPVVKLNNRYRYRITVVGQNEKPLRQLLAAYMKAFARRPEHRNMAVHTDCNLMD